MTTAPLTEAAVFGTPPGASQGAVPASGPTPASSDWLVGIRVVIVTDSAQLTKLTDNFAAAIQKRTVNDPMLLTVDCETCAVAQIRDDYNHLIRMAQTAQSAFESFPAPKQIVDPVIRQERDDAKATADELRKAVTAQAKQVQKAGLHPYVGQVRLIQVYAPWVAKVFVIDRWAMSPDALLDFGVRVLMDERVVWVGHNITFDCMILGQPASWNTPILPARAPHCTLLQTQALVSLTHVPKTLASRCEVVLGRKVPKDMQMSDWSNPHLTTAQLEYAAADVVATWLLYRAQARMVANHSPQLPGDDEWVDQRRLPTENCRRVYDLMRGAIPAVCEIIHTGMGFDAARHTPLAQKLEQDSEAGRAHVLDTIAKHSDAGAPVVENPGSVVQVARWLRHHLALSPGNPIDSWPTTETGQLACGRDEILANINQLDPKYQPVLKALADWSGAKKDFQDYGEAYQRWINPVTRRIHANFRIGGTETGRFSVTDPALQTINRESDFRELFIATAKGEAPHWMTADTLARLFVLCPDLLGDTANLEWELVAVDFGQIEARVVAVLTGDKVLLEAIERGLDIHSLTAFACFRHHQELVDIMDGDGTAPGLLAQLGLEGASLLDIIAHPDVLREFAGAPGYKPRLKWARQIAKSALFGLLFGQGPGGLQYLLLTKGGIRMTIEECRDVQTGLLGLYAGLRAWMQKTRDEASESHMVWSPQGRVYSVKQPDKINPDTGMIQSGDSYWYTKSINTPAQAGAAEIMLRVLCDFPNAWGELRGICRLVHVVHDELVAEVPKPLVQRAMKIMEDTMVKRATQMFPAMPKRGLADGGHGPSWGAAK